MTPALDLLKKVRAEHRVHSYEHDPKAASYGSGSRGEARTRPGASVQDLAGGQRERRIAGGRGAGRRKPGLEGAGSCRRREKGRNGRSCGCCNAPPVICWAGSARWDRKSACVPSSIILAQPLASIFVSAGRRGLEVELAPAVLAEHTQAKFADIGRCVMSIGAVW